MPSIQQLTSSPAARNRGGVRHTPTPAGVPVRITSGLKGDGLSEVAQNLAH